MGLHSFNKLSGQNINYNCPEQKSLYSYIILATLYKQYDNISAYVYRFPHTNSILT